MMALILKQQQTIDMLKQRVGLIDEQADARSTVVEEVLTEPDAPQTKAEAEFVEGTVELPEDS